MARFDPDAYLASPPAQPAFDPDEFLRSLPSVEVTPATSGQRVDAVPGPRRNYALSEVPMAAARNVPESAGKFFGGVVEAITSPVQTLTGVLDAGAGALRNSLPQNVVSFIDQFDTNPEATQRAVQTANAIGKEYKDRYGSYEAIKRTFAEDPVNAAADLSMLLSGGAQVAKLGAKATAATPSVSAPLTQAASVLQTGARRIDPLSAVAPVAEAGGRFAGKATGATANYLSRVMDPKAAALANAAEGRGQEIINALRNYDEYVAGGMPTAAVAAAPVGSTRYAALQDEVSGRMTTAYRERDIANKAARERALADIAQDEAALRAAENARQAVTKPLYGKADKQLIVADDTINTLLNRPSMEKALARAKQLAAERNETFQVGKNVPEQKVGSAIVDTEGRPLDVKTIPAEYAKFNGKSLHYLKLAMDDLIKDPKTFGLGSNEIAAIKNTRGEFLNWFEGKSENYAAARQAYAEASKPIDVMQVGQYLQGKLKPTIETPVGERAGVFSAAVQEAPTTLKRSTGQSRYTQLTDVLSPADAKIVEGIRKDLAREAEFKSQAAAGAKGDKAVPAAELSKAPAFFSRIATIANTIVDRLQGRINQKVALELATEMLDPKLAAEALEKALARQAKGEKLADPFKRAGEAASRAMRSETGLGLRSPLTLGGVQVSNALAAENQNRNELRK
jgi:hypothetical protein